MAGEPNPPTSWSREDLVCVTLCIPRLAWRSILSGTIIDVAFSAILLSSTARLFVACLIIGLYRRHCSKRNLIDLRIFQQDQLVGKWLPATLIEHHRYGSNK